MSAVVTYTYPVPMLAQHRLVTALGAWLQEAPELLTVRTSYYNAVLVMDEDRWERGYGLPIPCRNCGAEAQMPCIADRSTGHRHSQCAPRRIGALAGLLLSAADARNIRAPRVLRGLQAEVLRAELARHEQQHQPYEPTNINWRSALRLPCPSCNVAPHTPCLPPWGLADPHTLRIMEADAYRTELSRLCAGGLPE